MLGPFWTARTLALCIVSTVGSLLWTLVLLVLLFYTFGAPGRLQNATLRKRIEWKPNGNPMETQWKLAAARCS